MKLRAARRNLRVPGFRFAGVACGLKEDGRRDVALICAERPAAVAGAFTRNRFAAPPVGIARARVRSGRVQAVVVNTKSANAGTGEAGRQRALASCRLVASLLGIPERLVVPCSTGKIGLPLSWAKIERGIRLAVDALSPGGFSAAAEAIRTTDAFAKTSLRKLRIDGVPVIVAGFAKGAGMIHPQMATTLCYVLTDAQLATPALRRILRASLADTFNAITVDGDTSTNDTCLLLASGVAGTRTIRRGSIAEQKVGEAVHEVLGELAHMVVADGEGASKVVTVTVAGARTAAEADRAARAVANSILVKTALHGADPNWGRIACALGYSGASFLPERVTIRIGGVLVARAAAGPGPAAERRARRAMLRREFPIEIDLGAGRRRASVLTTDLGVAYVRFNSEYGS